MARKVQAEIKQTKPFDTLEEEAYVALLRTADQLQRRASELLKAHGLSPAQYNALRILRGAGREGLPCSEIGERMISRDPDITRLVDRLERRGLVERGRDPEDRRVVVTRITAAGLEAIKALDRPTEELLRRLLGPLEGNRLESLIQLLDEARSAAD